MGFNRRVVSSALFLLSIIVFLSAPIVLSQNATTVTSTEFSYYSMTTVFTSSNTALDFNPFTVSGHSGSSCYYKYYAWDSTGFEGQELLGNLTSDNKIDFYVMSEGQFSNFQAVSGRTCQSMQGNGLVNALGVTTYALNWVIPTEGGTYYLVFYNPYAKAAAINLVAWTENEVATVAEATSTIVWTETRTLTPTLTQTTASQTQTKTTQAFTTGGLDYVAIIAVVLVLAIIAVVALRRRGMKPSPPIVPKEAAQKRFCINCGAELPPAVKFCSKCGSAQS